MFGLACFKCVIERKSPVVLAALEFSCKLSRSAQAGAAQAQGEVGRGEWSGGGLAGWAGCGSERERGEPSPSESKQAVVRRPRQRLEVRSAV